jgi:hypothetical protein
VSTEDLFGVVAAGGGGFIGVAGAVGVAIVNGKTWASIGNGAQINVDQTGVGASQSVNVSAVDAIKTFTLTGGLALGLGGITGAVDIGVVHQDTAAWIDASPEVGDASAEVHAAASVDVNALSAKQLLTSRSASASASSASPVPSRSGRSARRAAAGTTTASTTRPTTGARGTRRRRTAR